MKHEWMIFISLHVAIKQNIKPVLLVESDSSGFISFCTFCSYVVSQTNACVVISLGYLPVFFFSRTNKTSMRTGV